MMLLEVDPNLVQPGWTPMIVVLLLAVVLVLLGRSMIKQFGKIDVPADHDPAATGSADDQGPAPAPGEQTVTPRDDQSPIPDLRSDQSSGTGTATGSTSGSTPPERRP